MKVNTIPGAAYALTCTAACSVQALLSDASCLTVLETENSGQYIFVAPTDAVEVSDEHALVTQTFKVAALGLAAQGGIRLGEDAVLKNLTAEASTFSGTVNANGGINAVSALAAGASNTGLNAGSHAVMSVLRNVYIWTMRTEPLPPWREATSRWSVPWRTGAGCPGRAR